MDPNDERPAGHHPRGPSKVDQLSGDRQEDVAPKPGRQLPLLIARLPKNADEEVRVSIDEYRGHVLLDIRIFADFTAANVPMPTKNGVSIRIGQLADLADALRDALVLAHQLGLLSDGD